MTAQTPTILKTYFETGDFPTQAQFTDLIDSNLNLVVSAAQTVLSNVSFTATVSASAMATGNLSASGTVVLTNFPASSTTWSPGFTGFTATVPTVNATYQKMGKICFIYLNTTINGTSNATTFTITTLPFTAAGTTPPFYVQATDNGAQCAAIGQISGTTITLTKGVGTGGGSWTGSGNKSANLLFYYETAT